MAWAASDWKSWLGTSEIFEGLAAEYWPTADSLSVVAWDREEKITNYKRT